TPAFTVRLVRGALLTPAGGAVKIPSYGLRAPVTYSLGQSGTGLTIDVSTGAASTSVIFNSGEAKHLVGSVIGSDGCAVTFDALLTGDIVAATMPDAPLSVNPTGLQNSLQLDVVDGATNGSAITYHKVYGSAVQGFIPGPANLLLNVNTASPFILTGLPGGVPFYAVVQAGNTVGDGAFSTEVSDIPTDVPAQPVVTAIGINGQIRLSWAAVADRGSPIIAYDIHRGSPSSFTPSGGTLITSVLAAGVYIDGGLTNGTAYNYKIIARNAVGSSLASAVATATPNTLTLVTDTALVAPSGETNPVVGSIWGASDPIYSVAPVSVAYQWLRGTTSVGSAAFYTVQDADAAAASRGTLTRATISTFADGSSDTRTTTASAMPRRTRANVAYGIGKLTPANYGSVFLSSKTLGLVHPSAAAVSSWTTAAASTGTSTHWTRTNGDAATGRTPKVAAAGVTASLSDASYVFAVTSVFGDGITEVSNLTITPAANVFTLGQGDSWTLVGTTHNSIINGSTIEIAAGVDLTGVTRQFLYNWRFATMTTFRPHDGSRMGWPCSWTHQSTFNLTLNNLEVRGPCTGATARMFWQVASTSSPVLSENIVVNNFKALCDPQYFVDTSVCNYAFGGSWTRNITINDAETNYVKGGWGGSGTVPAAINDGVYFNRWNMRYWYDNQLITGYSSIEHYIYRDCNFIAPARIAPLLHVDGVQVHDQCAGAIIDHKNVLWGHADGTAAIQCYFAGNGFQVLADGSNANQFILENIIHTGCHTAGNIGNSKNDQLKRYQTLYQQTNLVPQDLQYQYVAITGSVSVTGTTKHSGVSTADMLTMWGYINITEPHWTVTNSIAHQGRPTLNGTSAPVLPDFTAYLNADPYAALAAVPWATLTTAQCVAALKTIAA
ncbi:MAG: fibronectin type III domain-containing protein, partial [Vicinamibacterales bacterium]